MRPFGEKTPWGIYDFNYLIEETFVLYFVLNILPLWLILWLCVLYILERVFLIE